MKYKIILLTLCLIPLLSNAQWQERGGTFDLVHLERHQFQLNLLSPGFTYELGLFRNQSVSSNLGFGLATYEEGYVFGLAMNNRYRYYHNFNRRARLDKNTSGNSGNYIAAAQAIFFSQLQISTNVDAVGDFNLGFFGMVYGIQRTYEKGFNFNVELGAGYYRGDGVPSGYGPLINVTLGWVATKRKKKVRF
ncbi:hypothetical protein [Flagellimonas marinaquae]|jgi:hypothetical protein|uniref:hypothetical protein n=1 Tax=Flagellimonas marinaquae TaxID=254955 RepID=UPI000F8D5FD3|nr:hypothetical protein [Allomuricauda aquimarina]